MNIYKVGLRVKDGDLTKFKLLFYPAKDEDALIKELYKIYQYEFDDINIFYIHMEKKYNGKFIDRLFGLYVTFVITLVAIMSLEFYIK